MHILPEGLLRCAIPNSQETPPIEHLQQQPLTHDAHGFHQRRERVFHEFEGCDHACKIDATICEGKRLRAAQRTSRIHRTPYPVQPGEVLLEEVIKASDPPLNAKTREVHG